MSISLKRVNFHYLPAVRSEYDPAAAGGNSIQNRISSPPSAVQSKLAPRYGGGNLHLCVVDGVCCQDVTGFESKTIDISGNLTNVDFTGQNKVRTLPLIGFFNLIFSIDHRSAMKRVAAEIVALISSVECAAETKHASNCEGGKYTPFCSIALKYAAKRPVSDILADVKSTTS